MTFPDDDYLGNVLIVDDTPGNLALLSDTLSEAHYRVLVATDGLTALEQMQYIKPDIVLLDVLMPGIDGFETCKRLKANPGTRNIPIVFMTGLTELDHLLRGFDEGAIDYLVKPIRPAEVLARIEVHLAQCRNLQRAERLLAETQLAAVAVSAAGVVHWMTSAGEKWLSEFTADSDGECPHFLGQTLPATLNDRFLAWVIQGEPAGQWQAATGFTVCASILEHPDEFLLLLQRDEFFGDLTPQALREKLKLTFREAEILMWIARGKTNKEIGLILKTSPRTVNKHLEHVFEKLGVSTRTAAVAQALK